MHLQCRDKTVDLSSPVLMGVLNVTPDSFSDGGLFVDPERAVEHALRMEREGAAIIDVGGESTRPGANSVSAADEITRVLPVIRKLVSCLKVPVSIDSSKPEVVSAAIEAGAGMVNDVCALQAPGAIELLSGLDVPVCLMHMQGKPRTMQDNPSYDDVTRDVIQFLKGRVESCIKAGIGVERLVVDPGFGFGKTVEHNFRLLAELNQFRELNLPILVGISRKSMIGAIIGKSVEDRVFAGIALATLAAWNGASIIRTHDVAPTVDALSMYRETRRQIEAGDPK